MRYFFTNIISCLIIVYVINRIKRITQLSSIKIVKNHLGNHNIKKQEVILNWIHRKIDER